MTPWKTAQFLVFCIWSNHFFDRRFARFAAFVNRTFEGSKFDMNDKAGLKAICADPKMRLAVLQELINAGKDVGLKG